MRVGLAFTMVLAACTGGGGSVIGDGPPLDGDPAALTCMEIAAGLRERSESVSKQCSEDLDCTIVGYASNDGIVATCNCAPAFATNCEGEGVNAAAWSADARAQALLLEWRNRCLLEGCRNPVCGCDCGWGDWGCSTTTGLCYVRFTSSCFPTPVVDAAVDG